MARITWLVAVLVLAACQSSPSLTARPSPPASSPVTALAIEHAIPAMSRDAQGQPLWPGFEPTSIPLAVFDGERTWLFRYPTPLAPFEAAGDGVMSTPGRIPEITANTSADIGGIATGTLLLTQDAGRSVEAWAAIAVHETFHVFQRKRHPGWIGNEVDLFTYPVDDATRLGARRLETRALVRALADADNTQAACWTRATLALRSERYSGMDANHVAYERGTELNEGLANYVQLRAAGGSRASFALPADEFPAAQVRQRAYASGTALALLLDRFAPAWRDRFEADDAQTLDGALAKAVPAASDAPACGFSADERAAAVATASQDIAALVAGRAKRLAEFQASVGWTIVVDATQANPLWPQGFDPLNVERIDDHRILHTRFSKFGNDAGAIETMGRMSLSTGVGTHPLFQGVQRVVVSGVGKPTIVEVDGITTLTVDGVAATFKGARLDMREREVHLQLK